jgi:hypothetical protein
MQTKIDPKLWDALHEYPRETKLAVLWMLTNRQLTPSGYCPASVKTFQHETELSEEDLRRAYEFFREDLVKTAKGYWLKKFIRHQIGENRPALARDKRSRPVVASIEETKCPELKAAFLAEYPCLAPLFSDNTPRPEHPEGNTPANPRQNA